MVKAMSSSLFGTFPKGTLPSKVTTWPWVYCIPENGHEAADPQYVGKWMIFGSFQGTDMTQLDRFWLQIETNFHEKQLYHAKVSTAFQNSENSNSKTGVICCYTRDFRDTDDVKRTAEKLREILGPDYKAPMYYKTDNATAAGLYARTQSRGVSMYRHLLDGTFWHRVNGKWEILH